MRRLVEIAAGAIFVIAAMPKFFAFGWELDAFRRFGLPVPEAWVIAAGIIELVGGLLLLLGRHVLPAALALGATMAVAVWSSGILEGDVIPSLTLAPALLAACVFLVATAMHDHGDRGSRAS
ncbi:MAG: DoxX family membrane protein [Solirubrobacteraceae bacterium]